MEVQEHFYSDDPSRGPVDGKTTLRGVGLEIPEKLERISVRGILP